jgi:hypothetical protein
MQKKLPAGCPNRGKALAGYVYVLRNQKLLFMIRTFDHKSVGKTYRLHMKGSY